MARAAAARAPERAAVDTGIVHGVRSKLIPMSGRLKKSLAVRKATTIKFNITHGASDMVTTYQTIAQNKRAIRNTDTHVPNKPDRDT